MSWRKLVKKVCILLSTYNGEKYILDQLNSIKDQKSCSVHIVVRDDGSTDDTAKIVESFSPELELYLGKNIGYKRSFMHLLLNAPEGYDYYAFSDQDDVWLTNKLSAAIEQLNLIPGPSAYCSRPIYVDENINEIQGMYSNLDEIPCGVIKPEWAISTGLIALGCTFVWNKEMQKIIKSINREDLPFAHDNFLSVLCPLVGTLYKDKKGYILYRQHVGNASGNKKQNKYSLTRVMKRVKDEKQNNSNYELRKYIYDNYQRYIENDNLNILKKSLNYKIDATDLSWLLKANYANGLSKKEEMKYYWHVLSKTL